MDKQIIVYLYYGMLLSQKKKKTTDTQNNMNESQKHYTKSKKPDTRLQVIPFI